jgi:hypothetical protein
MPGQKLFLLLRQDVSGAFVGGVNVTANLPISKLPPLVGRVHANLVELRPLQEELHHLGDLLLEQGFVRLGHDCLGRVETETESSRCATLRFVAGELLPTLDDDIYV